ncbi:homoserine kinase [Dermatophilus congolensis]|uniref:homoserine kinase n=1 Tax=Dermatophilus congolensis TaxID=1863 RepID=UPI00312C9FE1
MKGSAVVDVLPVGTAVRVRSCASSANLGPGFDSVGLALGVWDTYVAGVVETPGLSIVIDGDDQGVPRDERHLVYASMRTAFEQAGVAVPVGLVLRCASTVPQGRGMGSSAAAITAGVALAFGLIAVAEQNQGDALDQGEVQIDLDAVSDLASRLERHPDNASASVFGGATVSWVLDEAGEQVESVPRFASAVVPLHPDIEPLVVVPTAQLPTSIARSVLPASVPHSEAARNSGTAALLTLALSQRPDLLLPATREWLHQEQRRGSLGASMELVDELRARGLAAVISGAGPSVLVLGSSSGDVSVVEAVVAGRSSQGWKVLRPGVPTRGVRVERVTLEALSGGDVSLA